MEIVPAKGKKAPVKAGPVKAKSAAEDEEEDDNDAEEEEEGDGCCGDLHPPMEEQLQEERQPGRGFRVFLGFGSFEKCSSRQFFFFFQ